LHLQLQLLADGVLYSAPGICYEPLAYLDTRIAEVLQKRDRLQLSLDTTLRQAEQLVGATVSS
jgi:hypothetical protein